MIKWCVESMWRFWFVLLAISLATAAAIYFLWLKQSI
jgi:hypothetical protein